MDKRLNNVVPPDLLSRLKRELNSHIEVGFTPSNSKPVRYAPDYGIVKSSNEFWEEKRKDIKELTSMRLQQWLDDFIEINGFVVPEEEGMTKDEALKHYRGLAISLFTQEKFKEYQDKNGIVDEMI